MRVATVLSLVLAISLGFQVGCTHRTEPQVVPPGFRYPEIGVQVALPDPLLARRVAGRVLDPNGDPVKKALVELTKPNWQERIIARFTDDHGRFDFPNLALGEYPVRVTKPGFAPLLARIMVSKSGPRGVELTMHLAT
ncbi:MAG: carboxypeptidase-like regulatory domain-containing protein [Nitrospirales bacterium]